MRRFLRWVGWSVGGAVAVLIITMLATTRYGDAALYPPRGESPRIEVLVVSHGYHSGLVVPRAAVAELARRRGLAALDTVGGRFATHPWLEIGWGDASVYTQVPNLASLTVSTALRALLKPGNPSVLHVVGLPAHPRVTFPAAEMVALKLSETGFERLVAGLDATFARNGRDGAIEELGPGLYGPSRFFRAVGNFHLLKVCNHWVADRLDAAGVPTTPVLATAPQGLLWDLSWRARAVRLPPAAR